MKKPEFLVVIVIALLVTTVVTHALPKSPGGEPTLYLRASSVDPERAHRWLREHDYDAHLVETPTAELSWKSLHIIASEAEYEGLNRQTAVTLGDLRVLFNRTADSSHTLSDADGFSMATLFRSAQRGVPRGYHSLRDVESFLFYVANKFSSICQVVDFTREFGPGRTHRNNSMLGVKMSRNPLQNEDEPNILIVSLHHARELVVTEIALRVIVELTSLYGREAAVTKLLDENQIWVVPVVNPDGLEHVFTHNNWWRKNRRDLGNGLFGVDLNRNYDIGWENGCVSGGSKGKEDYRGAKPESEPEVQSLVRFSEIYTPAKVLDFHSFGREVLVGYQCTALDPLVSLYINETGSQLAKLIGFSIRTPSDDGEHQEYQIKKHTNFAFLVEVGDSFQPPYSEALEEVKRVMPLVRSFLDTPIPLRGHVMDRHSGRPIGNATIDVSGIRWLSGESRRTNPTFGSYYSFLPPGQYEFTFSAPGYQSTSVTVVLPRGEARSPVVVQDVYMELAGKTNGENKKIAENTASDAEHFLLFAQ